MPEKGEELYKILKADPNYEGVGSDYNKFKTFFSDEKNYTNLYNTLKADPNYEGIGKDVNAFSEYFGLKKKEQTQPFGGQIFTQGVGLGVKPISSTTSPSVSKQPKSIIPSESTDGKDFEESKKNILSKSDVKIETLPIYEQSQKQLRDADIQINSFNMIGNVDKIPDPKIREQAQIERDALLENRKGLFPIDFTSKKLLIVLAISMVIFGSVLGLLIGMNIFKTEPVQNKIEKVKPSPKEEISDPKIYQNEKADEQLNIKDKKLPNKIPGKPKIKKTSNSQKASENPKLPEKSASEQRVIKKKKYSNTPKKSVENETGSEKKK
jgi:hypothetical protein